VDRVKKGLASRPVGGWFYRHLGLGGPEGPGGPVPGVWVWMCGKKSPATGPVGRPRAFACLAASRFQALQRVTSWWERIRRGGLLGVFFLLSVREVLELCLQRTFRPAVFLPGTGSTGAAGGSIDAKSPSGTGKKG